ncbi:MAG: type II toxin-antitoxin system HicB family antitoxin, partial [bacterium]|nr:type II toxin-antitoxin system HicB family antitoxin [bacterium]
MSAARKEDAMAEYSYTVLFEPAEEGGYVVTCPALPGLVTTSTCPGRKSRKSAGASSRPSTSTSRSGTGAVKL